MIKVQTKLKVADNSGAKTLLCINVLGKQKNSAKVGDIIVAAVKTALPNGAIKKSTVIKAVVVRTRSTIFRKDGSCLKFNENAAVILGKDNNPKGSRIFGPIPMELKTKGFSKIISLAKDVL